MEILKENVQAGDAVKVLADAGNGSTVLERQGNWVRMDIINKTGEHKRDLWIPLSYITSCLRSDMDERTRSIIMEEIKKWGIN